MLTPINLKQFLEQFHAKHGNDCIKLDGRWVFSDGAWRDVNPLGMTAEPSANLYERSRLQVRYWEKRLRTAMEEFNCQKQNMIQIAKANIGQYNAGPPPNQRASVEQLERLKHNVAIVRKGLDEAQARLQANIPEARIQREAMFTENKAANERFVLAISEISI